MRYSWASELVRRFEERGGVVRPKHLARARQTEDYARRRALHAVAACIFWEIATAGDDGFEGRAPTMAVDAATRVYRKKGWWLLGRTRTELIDFAQETAAGAHDEDEVRKFLQERALPPPGSWR
jgi:hypothetical protein